MSRLVRGGAPAAAIVLAAALALLGGLLAAGGFLEREGPLVSESTPNADTTTPSGSPRPGEFGPTAPSLLVAVSAGEAWAVDGGGLWHHANGGWYGPMNPDPRLPHAWYDLAVDGDGTAWLAGDRGLWGVADGRWTNASDVYGAWRVVRAPDRGVWASTGSGPIHVSRSGDQLVRSNVKCPIWGTYDLAVADDGVVFGGGNGYSSGEGLVSIDDQGCEIVYPLGDGIDYAVGALLRDPLGGVVAVLYEPGSTDFSVDPWVMIRYDGTNWAVLRRGRDPAESVIGPDGEAWRIGWDVIVPVDDLAFDPDLFPTIDRPLSIAPDGTIWYSDVTGVKSVMPD